MQESLYQEKADIDRLMMLDSNTLVEYTSQRKLPSYTQTSISENLRRTHRQLVEMYGAADLATKSSELEQLTPQYHCPGKLYCPKCAKDHTVDKCGKQGSRGSRGRPLVPQSRTQERDWSESMRIAHVTAKGKTKRMIRFVQSEF